MNHVGMLGGYYSTLAVRLARDLPSNFATILPYFKYIMTVGSKRQTGKKTC